MTGLLSEFNIDISDLDAPTSGYDRPKDDIYEWELGNVSLKQGSKTDPTRSWIIFDYILGDEGLKFSELFELPKDPRNPTDKEVTRLGYYKQRLLSLGVAPEDVNTVTADQLVGSRGTFELRTKPGKDGNEYQNIVGSTFKTHGVDGIAAPAKKEKAATAVSNPFA
jgi:hypothetical protein